MGAPVSMTREEFEKTVNETIDKALDAKDVPQLKRLYDEQQEKIEKMQAFHKEQSDKLDALLKDDEARRRAEERSTKGNLIWDPQDRSHPYVAKYGHVVRNDTFKVRRAGYGKKDYGAQGSGLRAARYLRACFASAKDGVAIESVLKRWGDDWMVQEIEKCVETAKDVGSDYAESFTRERALGTTTFTGGGALVPLEYMMEIIELLRARNVVRAAGARVLPMARGTLTMPKQTGSGTAYYLTENTAVTASEQTLGQVHLLAKKLMALTPVSNDLIRQASPDADQFVRNDLIRTAANREDLAFIRGDGQNDTPRGLRYLAASANVTNVNTGGSTPDNEIDDLKDLMLALAGSDVDFEDPAWFMAPRTEYKYMFLRDSGNGFFFKDEMMGGTLLGFPYFPTTQIPINLAVTSTDESELYFADMSHILIGEAMVPEVRLFENATYADSGGTVRSGISQDQSVVRLVMEHDINTRHAEAIALKNDVPA